MQCFLFPVLVLLNNCTLTLVLMEMYTVFILMNALIPIKATSPDLKIKSIIKVHYTAIKIKHSNKRRLPLWPQGVSNAHGIY